MSLFPMFVKLEGRRCLVVGAGKVGESKIRSLLISRARVHVVAPWATLTVAAWAQAGLLQWSARPFQPEDLEANFLVVAATSSMEVNDQVYGEAQTRRVLCNVVDDPERCDFYYPAVVRRGNLQVAISTGGHSPALAQRLRREFEQQLAPLYAGWLEELGKKRQELFSQALDPEERRRSLHVAASRQAFDSRHDRIIDTTGGSPMSGKVLLVGAGPGDPELLTVKALKAIQAADVVLYDDLIGPQILELIPSATQARNVGKRCGRKSTPQAEINSQLIAFASFGLTVVRLKGGDPLIFGRAGEEMEALRKANVDFEVIPGVTSALASAAAAEVSLTHRKTASAVIFLSSHHADDRIADWKAYVACGATLALYMPGSNYGQVAARLISAGLKPATPCAIISQASLEREQIHRTTIDRLHEALVLPAPTLLLVGEVVGSADTVSEAAGAWLQEAKSAPAIADAFLGGPSHWSQRYLDQPGANL